MISQDSFTDIPTWNNGIWSTTTFDSHNEFRDFADSLFKEPGEYEFDETTNLFNEQAQLFRVNNYYCISPENTKDFKLYWDTEKIKSRKGVIFNSNGKTWYLTRYYYFWINFLKIYDKVKGVFDFPEVWDTQYHVSLYSLRCTLHQLHGAVTKKRQIAMSYYFSSELINEYWFEQGAVLKIGASDKKYINDVDGTWKYLNEYADFLNKNTAWYRESNPGKMGNWKQMGTEFTQDGKEQEYGNKSTIAGITFEKSPVKGIGGPTKRMFYEEGGEAPTADITFQFIKPAMKMGEISTGTFMIAGSVGQLDKCDPLKEFTFRPKGNTILPVLNKYVDSKGTVSETALFIPEQWSMLPYIDHYGNSLVTEALEALEIYFKDLKRTASPSNYQYEVSQHPRNLEEAFAYRKGSVFPLHLISAQMRRIDDKEYPYELIDLTKDASGNILVTQSNKLPIAEWPMDPKREDKEGIIQVWERPVNELGTTRPRWMSYLASIDPVRVGKTVTSNSLVSIYIYKCPVQVTRRESDTASTFLERDKIVACWCGRFDDINKTYKRLELMLEWYNSWTAVENNITGFIQYMESQRKLRYLASKKDMLFLKEGQANQNIYQEVGWTNSGRIFTDNLLLYGIDYLSEELEIITKPDGSVVKTIYGIERIPDLMLLKEMQGYQPGINVDRLIAYSALIAFAKLQIAHIGILKREENLNKNLQKSENIYTLHKGMFHNIGNTSTSPFTKPSRNPFKNLR
jgi:hypothetical protein